jgi:hypothetical protein
MSRYWYTDRSRYMVGFECRWKRFLRFYAFGTGIEANYIVVPLATGRYTHEVLANLLLRVKAGEEPDINTVNEELIKVLTAYREEVEKSRGLMGEEKLDHQLDLVTGLCHGYTRTVLPFLNSAFEIVDVEREFNYQIPDTNIIWMVRPDFTAALRGKDTGASSIHDFKTMSYWNEETGVRQWMNNVQMMANAFVVSNATGKTITSYTIHGMVKGNKKYPNLLTHGFYRPGNPPFQTEKWKDEYTRARMFSRVRVADYRNLPEWIWQVDAKRLGEKFPLIGPYTVHDYTASQFFAGVVAEEEYWKGIVKDLGNVDWGTDWKNTTFQHHLDSRMPRTFACHDFSGMKCQFYNICHKVDDGWKAPLANGFVRRVPHHTQEGNDEEVTKDVG